METITIKIKDKKNAVFFLDLINKFNFIVDVKMNKLNFTPSDNNKIAPIDWAESEPSISDFSGIWSGRNITLGEIRNKAWKRN